MKMNNLSMIVEIDGCELIQQILHTMKQNKLLSSLSFLNHFESNQL